MALKCCNKICQLVESIALYDTEKQKHRVLVVGRCKNPKCGCLKGEFIYWDNIKQRFFHEQIPKQNLKEIITKFKKFPNLTYIRTDKIRYGSMSNMHWKYQKNGNIYDFNNILVEKIQSELKQYGE